MPRLALPVLLSFLFAAPAHAVIKGSPSSHGNYTVRLFGKAGYCSGVVIARDLNPDRRALRIDHTVRWWPLVARHGHCARRRARRWETRECVGRCGRPASCLAAAGGSRGRSDRRGKRRQLHDHRLWTTDERWRHSSGAHEATLIAESPGALVDPNRSSSIGASACFGDSGGPVLRGGMLVGVISRASHPSPHLVCGHLTRWVPVTVSDSNAGGDGADDPPRDYGRQKSAQPTQVRAGAARSFKPFAMMAPVQ